MDKYGPGFEEGWVVLTMLVVSAVLQAATNVIGQAIASLDRMWWGFGLNALWALELVGGAWVFRDHGAIGLGGAYLLAYALHTAAVSVFTVLVLRQHFQVRTDWDPRLCPRWLPTQWMLRSIRSPEAGERWLYSSRHGPRIPSPGR